MNMRINHYIPADFDEVMTKFAYKIDTGSAKYAQAIAYQAIVSDEIMTLYEIYIDNTYRFFGVYELDQDDGDIEKITDVFKVWARASDITLLATVDFSFLFELKEPLRIVSGR